MPAKTRRIPDDVLDVLARSAVDGQKLTLPEQLDRKLYLRVDEVIQNLGGKWDRKAKGHVFPGEDLAARIAGAVVTGEFIKLDDHGVFFTPHELASHVIDLADIKHGMTVLEPSAGYGMLALMAANQAGINNVMCVELLAENCRQLNACGLKVAHGDFLTLMGTKWADVTFDRVVMNPPFALSADVDHVLHALDFLKPGGRLVAIMSNGITFRNTAKYIGLRKIIESVDGSIEPNPEGSFKSAGTNVNTVTVVINSPR